MTTVADQLVELQRVDTQADQLEIQRTRHPLRAELAAATEQMRSWELRRAGLRGRIDALNDEIERDEARGAAIATHLERLERQLKTVIAPREAEALMHEITTLTTERDELDIAELEAMEQQTTLETDLATHLVEEDSLRSAMEQADAALAVVVASIDQELDGLRRAREQAVGVLPADVLTRYERTRGQLGVVVAGLDGKRCTGCHLDLSAAEFDTVRADAAANGYTDCPQCGRILVL